jgi:uncharacterized membrane protein YkvA (DUF1232 family)
MDKGPVFLLSAEQGNRLKSLRERAHRLKRETMTLWYVCRHTDTPVAVKVLAGFVVAYALSPIDLIPDFIPVLGYLDDIIIVPAGIALVLRLTPAAVLTECRLQAEQFIARGNQKPRSRIAGAVIVLIWLMLTAALVYAWLQA